MSVKALFWALEQRIPTNPKMVLIHLSDWFNELEDSAWPSIPKLVERTGLSRSTVIRSTQWLVDNKLVIVEHRFSGGWKKSNRYRLALGVMAIQGCHSDTTVVSETTGLKCQSDTSIDTVKDTVKDTVNLATPISESDSKEKTNVKVSEVQDKFKSNSKEKSYSGFDPRPSGCAKFWRAAHAAGDDNGFQGEVSIARQKKLNDRRKELDDDLLFKDIIWKCCSDWVAFKKFSETHHGAYNMGLKPTIDKFHYWFDAAVDFTLKNRKVVKSIAQPLTKQPAPCTPIPKVTVQNPPSETMAEKFARQKKEREEKKAAYLANLAEETDSE